MLLTREECVQILQNFLKTDSDRSQLVDYSLERDSSAIGYLGDYYALTLFYCIADSENSHKSQLFVKALPQQSDEPEKGKIFQKEAFLYDTLLPKMQEYSNIKWSVECYYTRPDLCVFENVKLSGYGSAAAKQLEEAQLFQLLRTLAAIHASSLVYEQRQQVNIGDKFGERLPEITVAAHIAWFTTGLAAIVTVLKSLPGYQNKEQLEFIDTQLMGILQRVYGYVLPSKNYRNVLCHRDLWAGNILFPTDPKDAVILVDFQTCCYSPPAIDVCFGLYLNLTAKERCRLESKSIDFYYDWLQKDLQEFGLKSEDLITKAELLQSYEEFRLFGTVYTALVATVVKIPPELVTNEYKYIDRSQTLLNYMQQNAEFSKTMEMCCVEVMEVALLTK